jgi:hypothetical protein
MEPAAMKFVAVAAIVLAALGVEFGAWWAPFLASIVIGIAYPRARIALPIGSGIGLLMWGYPLASAHLKLGLGPAAESLAAIMGFGHQAAIPVILTCVVGLLLGLSGAWLGSAGRSSLSPSGSDQ